MVKLNSTEKRSTAKWVIRAGKRSEAQSLFLNGCVALRDARLGNLCLLPPDRASFYETFATANHAQNRVAISGIGGKFFRFLHELAIGDEILYPSRLDRRVYIGIVTGKYVYRQSAGAKLPHMRAVKWLGWVRKSAFSLGAQRELGAARTFFKFKSHGDEVNRLSKRVSPLQNDARGSVPSASKRGKAIFS